MGCGEMFFECRSLEPMPRWLLEEIAPAPVKPPPPAEAARLELYGLPVAFDSSLPDDEVRVLDAEGRHVTTLKLGPGETPHAPGDGSGHR